MRSVIVWVVGRVPVAGSGVLVRREAVTQRSGFVTASHDAGIAARNQRVAVKPLNTFGFISAHPPLLDLQLRDLVIDGLGAPLLQWMDRVEDQPAAERVVMAMLVVPRCPHVDRQAVARDEELELLEATGDEIDGTFSQEAFQNFVLYVEYVSCIGYPANLDRVSERLGRVLE
jgi:hypothetical protein